MFHVQLNHKWTNSQFQKVIVDDNAAAYYEQKISQLVLIK